MEIFILLGVAGILVWSGWSLGHDNGMEKGRRAGETSGFRAGVREYMRKQLIESNTIAGTYNNQRLTPQLLQEIRTELTNNINR
ncbi:MAG: hypothetical protein KJ914_10535 [Gammaproteobacteria bacterium]|nr:hypothetical protein [Gammaproteobacteria bacterium]MBU1723886.1 hypothetical protein [Gammaproteobacteria bacterium]MBU2006205.1 hypothetical protein [Gammaproteobacteria bacterium]